MKRATYEAIQEALKDLLVLSRAAGRPETSPELEMANIGGAVKAMARLHDLLCSRMDAVALHLREQQLMRIKAGDAADRNRKLREHRAAADDIARAMRPTAPSAALRLSVGHERDAGDSDK